MLVGLVLSKLISLYMLLIFVWTLASWFPDWRHQAWFRTVDSVVAPYVNLFRGLRLQFGMIDMTAMAAMFVLILFRMLLIAAAGGHAFP